MTEPRSYIYTTLRYVHDVRTGEFLNVGVVMHAASEGLLLLKTRKTFGRIKRTFPDLDGDAFHAAMQAVISRWRPKRGRWTRRECSQAMGMPRRSRAVRYRPTTAHCSGQSWALA